MNAIKILGFTDNFTVCDRCGKAELKGTWAIQDQSQDIFYLGSSCIAKKYEFTPEWVKQEIKTWKAAEKNKALIAQHIAPVEAEKARVLGKYQPITEETPDFIKNKINSIAEMYDRRIADLKKKYKIQ